ncbi:MAG: acyl-CoA dehydratase activase [Thermodesulfovibrionales bacterium]|nr:acyl-CoA dehydratase activase [Thermodesulfovibrionales bacterium]
MERIGLDVGSVFVKLVVLNDRGEKIKDFYIRHFGNSIKVALQLLKQVKKDFPQAFLSITGSAGKIIASILKISPINEIVAQSYSVKSLYPNIRTIIEIGGEDSKLIFLQDGRIKDFSMNSVCAAGTGSFLEQQAERLRLTIEEFSEMAEQSKRPSKIAGRCSVFAKSDMIHLQQIATPVEDIVAGLCFAVARNFKGAIAKGKDIIPPVSFQGGVAANKGMIRAFKEVFGLNELFVPPDFLYMGAIGAALKDRDDNKFNNFDIESLDSYISTQVYSDNAHKPLLCEGDRFLERHLKSKDIKLPFSVLESQKVKAYLGIDIGSISTNLAIVDEEGNLLAKSYLMTAGRPIEAVKQGLREVYQEVGEAVEIVGVGTTGSGRYMIADYVGADIVKNEITAQATAAIYIDPKVDTIFEIGGQDSKYISIENGMIIDFEMNKACAAGTGSFLEEQAEKLDVSIKNDFAEMALRAKNPCRLGERCTVFMENSLMSNLQKGAEKENLLAGLAYSIVQNYINRVVAGKKIGNNIFFQGGVAFNKSVVAAFEKYLGREITVPPNHDVTGAIGMALIAKRHMQELGNPPTKFKGFQLSQKPYEISSFECKGCPNVCEINRVKVADEEGFLYYGGRCEKYDIRQQQKSKVPDLFTFREEMLWKAHLDYQSKGSRRSLGLKIGLPYIFLFHDYLPFWSTLLWELGFEVVVSPKTNKQIKNLGLENIFSEACFPVKVAHGHIKYLINEDLDILFIPSSINLNKDTNEYVRGLSCPYVQTIPYVTKSITEGKTTITPIIDLSRGDEYLKKELKRVFSQYDISKKDIERAIFYATKSQDDFITAIKNKGLEVLQEYLRSKEPIIIIVGRAYNAYDPGMNLEIPKKLNNINILSLPMDFLPIESVSISNEWPNMYWRAGQRILRASKIISKEKNLYPIYIGNFSCGPDSFILKYFREELGDKPFLHIEIDEHSADAGALTRCEAFLDSINSFFDAKSRTNYSVAPNLKLKKSLSLEGRTVYIPRMVDHAFAVSAAYNKCGIKSEVLPLSDKESVDIGKKYLSGKECYPCTVTTGDIIKMLSQPGVRPEQTAFLMPTAGGPCRFGQYNVLQNIILKKIGYEDVLIFAPEQHSNNFVQNGKGNEFTKTAWAGIVAFDILYKCLHETRPYEAEKGITDALYKRYLDKIYSLLCKSPYDELKYLMETLKNDFKNIPKKNIQKPLIGVVGEIFVRSHTFSNEDLVRKIEALGGEVYLAPMEEWIYYVNFLAERRAIRNKDTSALLAFGIKKLMQAKIEHALTKPFKGFLKTLHEPKTKELLEMASPYVHDSFEGETILSIGKAIDFIQRGCCGIINVMPFGCMPGTIVTALLKVLSDEYDVPCISIPYDGTESTATELQIEAFMEAATNKFHSKTL